MRPGCAIGSSDVCHCPFLLPLSLPTSTRTTRGSACLCKWGYFWNTLTNDDSSLVRGCFFAPSLQIDVQLCLPSRYILLLVGLVYTTNVLPYAIQQRRNKVTALSPKSNVSAISDTRAVLFRFFDWIILTAGRCPLAPMSCCL